MVRRYVAVMNKIFLYNNMFLDNLPTIVALANLRKTDQRAKRYSDKKLKSLRVSNVVKNTIVRINSSVDSPFDVKDLGTLPVPELIDVIGEMSDRHVAVVIAEHAKCGGDKKYLRDIDQALDQYDSPRPIRMDCQIGSHEQCVVDWPSTVVSKMVTTSFAVAMLCLVYFVLGMVAMLIFGIADSMSAGGSDFSSVAFSFVVKAKPGHAGLIAFVLMVAGVMCHEYFEPISPQAFRMTSYNEVPETWQKFHQSHDVGSNWLKGKLLCLRQYDPTTLAVVRTLPPKEALLYLSLGLNSCLIGWVSDIKPGRKPDTTSKTAFQKLFA